MDGRGDVAFHSTACCFAEIAVALMLFSEVTGILVVAPENRVTAVGQIVQLNCSTNDTLSVNWQHFPLGSRTPRDVYISRTVVSPYHPRFAVHREELGITVTAYNLLITDVRMEDAGTYRCVDRTGFGEQRDAELTVLGSFPKCTTNIGPSGFICENDCHNPIEKIRTSCSIEYAGNIAPEMQWTTTSVQDTIQPQPITNVLEKTVSSELNIRATKSMDGALVIWYSPLSMQINWTSAPIKILYAKQSLSSLILSQSGTVTCSANSSQDCSYTWIVKTNTDNELKTFEGDTFEVNQPGTYLCEANCPFRHTPCTIIAMHLEYKNGDECSQSFLWVIGLVIVFLAVGLVILVVTFCIFKLRTKQNSPLSSKNGLQQSSVNLLFPCWRKTSDNSPSRNDIPPITRPSDDVCLLELNSNGTSSSSSNGSSQSGSDETQPCMKVKSSGSCNFSAPPPA